VTGRRSRPSQRSPSALDWGRPLRGSHRVDSTSRYPPTDIVARICRGRVPAVPGQLWAFADSPRRGPQSARARQYKRTPFVSNLTIRFSLVVLPRRTGVPRSQATAKHSDRRTGSPDRAVRQRRRPAGLGGTGATFEPRGSLTPRRSSVRQTEAVCPYGTARSCRGCPATVTSAIPSPSRDESASRVFLSSPFDGGGTRGRACMRKHACVHSGPGPHRTAKKERPGSRTACQRRDPGPGATIAQQIPRRPKGVSPPVP
jgi:hypothetical protein